MAIVPTATPGAVSPGGPATPFQNTRGADLSAFGGLEAQAQIGAGEALQQVSDQLGEEIIRRQEEDNLREVANLDNQYAAILRNLGYGDGTDQNPGFYSSRGETALSLSNKAIQGVEDARNKIAEGITNPAVKDRFEELAFRRSGSELNTIARHTATQRIAANDATSQARLGEALQDAAAAFNDPTRLSRSIGVAKGEVALMAVRNGWSAEVKDSKTEEALTAIFRAAIDAALVQDPATARELFETHKDKIDGDVRADIERSIVRVEEQQAALLTSTVNDAIAVLGVGKIPPNVINLQAQLRASPGKRAANMARALDEAIEGRDGVQNFNRMPIAEQMAALQNLREQKVMTGKQARQFGRLQTSHANTIRMLKNDNGLQVAVDAGIIDPTSPLDYADPSSLRKRRIQAETANEALGVPIALIRPGEVTALTTMLEQSEADQIAGVFQSLNQGFGSEALGAIADQIAPKRPDFAVALSAAGTRLNVAREIVVGAKLVRDNSEVKPSATEIEDSVLSVYGNLFQETPSALAPHIAAATALYAIERVASGNFEFDQDKFEDALERAVGGVIKFNGQNLILPSGVDEDAFEETVEKLTHQTMWDLGNGQPLFGDGTEFDPELFDRGFLGGSDAQLLTVGPGVYRVFLPGLGYVVTPEGELYELDLNNG